MEKMKVKVASGRKVRDAGGRPLSAGEEHELLVSSYLRRRIKDGDLIEVTSKKKKKGKAES